MASLGAKVLQTRSVEMAMVHRVPLRVLSTFDADRGGTLLCDEEDIVEKNPVTGIAYTRDEAKITLLKIPDQPGVAASIFGPLEEAGINVDMIVQNISEDGRRTDLTFTVSRGRARPRTRRDPQGSASDRLQGPDLGQGGRQGLDHRHRNARTSRRRPD